MTGMVPPQNKPMTSHKNIYMVGPGTYSHEMTHISTGTRCEKGRYRFGAQATKGKVHES